MLALAADVVEHFCQYLCSSVWCQIPCTQNKNKKTAQCSNELTSGVGLKCMYVCVHMCTVSAPPPPPPKKNNFKKKILSDFKVFWNSTLAKCVLVTLMKESQSLCLTVYTPFEIACPLFGGHFCNNIILLFYYLYTFWLICKTKSKTKSKAYLNSLLINFDISFSQTA